MFAATLIYTPTVACHDDILTFTCTLSGSVVVWDITPPQGQGNVFRISLSASNTEDTVGNPAFRGVLTDSSGPLTATLTSLSEASIVEGTMVECAGESSREGPLTITVAGEWVMGVHLDSYTHRSTLPSTEHKSVLRSKRTQLL